MKKISLFLLCISSLSLAVAVNKPNSPSQADIKNPSSPPPLAMKTLPKNSDQGLFASKYLGSVLYLTSATKKDEYVEVTINTSGYSFKPHKGFKGGKSVRVHLSPTNYTPLIVEGNVGHYSYTVKRVALAK